MKRSVILSDGCAPNALHPRPKVVLFASASTSVVQFRLEFIRSLIRRGPRVDVVAPEDTPTDGFQIETAGAVFRRIELHRTGMNPLVDLRLIYRLWRRWREQPYDHLICYAHKPAIYGLLTSPWDERRRCWVMLSGLGYAFTGKGWRRGFARTLFRFAYPPLLRRAAGVFLLNRDDARTLRDCGILSDRIATKVLKGEGVPLDAYPRAEPPATDPYRFLMIARLLSDKGVREYVRTAEFVKRSHRAIEFHLVGPADSNPAAISDEEISTWQRDGIVAYHGTQSDVRPFLRDCTVYVLPSYREGTPRTVLEAMATGRPVITTDAPGCRETVFDAGAPDADGVRQGRNGFLVPVKSVDALVAAMRRFIADPDLARRMGAEGRRLAEEYYDVHKVNEQILEFMGLAGPQSPQV